MTTEAAMRHEVRARLRAVGFELVQEQTPSGRAMEGQADYLAWAPDANGEMAPWAAVEIKAGQFKTPDLALPALARSRDFLGTVEHYAVVNGEWFKADRGVRSLDPVSGPTAPPHGSDGVLADEDLATRLLLTAIWLEMDKQRGRAPVESLFPSVEQLVATSSSGIQTGEGFVRVRPDVLWRARRRALVDFTNRAGRGGAVASHPAMASAVAQLVGPRVQGTILDPFCGTGSFLWAVMDRTSEAARDTQFVGRELNPGLAEWARSIGQTAPLPATIDTGDAFAGALPAADVVVAAPPLGLKLFSPHELLDGSKTKDMAAAAIDLSLRHLNPGGRAVLHINPGFTFQKAMTGYRNFLASSFRVGALIGLPSGTVPGTGIRSVLLVIEQAPPGDTFVAQLGEDWQTQLSPTGAAMQAALAHLDGTPVKP